MSHSPPRNATSGTHLRFDDGAAYEAMMGRWSALVATPFLDWVALPPGLAWLDDGCGNGAFTEQLVARQRPSSVDAVREEGHTSQEPPSTWASAIEASEKLWRQAGLAEVRHGNSRCAGRSTAWATPDGSCRARNTALVRQGSRCMHIQYGHQYKES